jgi:hypothetical protein
MANLINSQRSVLKATYVPTKSDPTTSNTSRVVEKVALIRQLNLQPNEFTDLKENKIVKGLSVNLDNVKNSPFKNSNVPLVDLIQKLTTDNSPTTTGTYAPLLANVSNEQLSIFSQTLAGERQNVVNTVSSHINQMKEAYKKAFPNSSTQKEKVINWAIKNKTEDAAKLQKLMTTQMPMTSEKVMTTDATTNIVGNTVANFVNNMSDAANTAVSVANSFLDRFKIEPVGRLHLERIEMTPVGIEHGELVHSVPLTPQETVNISHREWSTTTQTFENIVSDSLTNFSEQGVVDKTDIAQATTNESRQQSSLDVNGNVSASYSGAGFSVTASTGIDYNTHSDDFKSVKDSLAHSVAITRTASARARKDHRTSFRVSSVAGTEDLAVQVLTNPTNNAIRVDYFQLMRKWQVNLIRYGLRMTYDLVLPNPGSSLIIKVLLLDSLKQAISANHAFSVTLNQITTTSWQSLEEQFGVSLDPPPVDPFQTMQAGALENSKDSYTSVPVQLQIPDGYEVTGGQFFARIHWVGNAMQLEVAGEAHDPGSTPVDGGGQFVDNNGNPTSDAVVGVTLTANSIVGRTGNVAILVSHYNVAEGGWTLKLQASPTSAAIEAWQSSVLDKLRDADTAMYQASLQKLKDQYATLQEEIGEFDALTLRRMEREEIMKGLLQWLFGPSFQLQPDVLDQYLNDPQTAIFQSGDNVAWQIVMQYGEYIKYIHNAIEWENVLFFPYPYFWDASSRWPFKLFLVHPDPEHRSFLRAGCARVVLTIRPGFEASFAAFMESYSLSTILSSDHPYITIGNEIRDFAMTNYEAIPPANPDKNVRPLLFPEQRKAWSDMQKLILLIEHYNTDQHDVGSTVAINAGNNQQVTPSSMKGIEYGTTLVIDPGTNNEESILVTAITNTSFYANFINAHPVNAKMVIDSDVKLYPDDLNTLKAYTGTNNLPLKDPWGKPFIYVYPGLHGDYDLVCYGKDGVEGGDGLDADITSWAEGSTVSTWYEYTPTSALDVVINSALTTKADPA